MPTSSIDTIRALFTYLIALVVILGGGLFLFVVRSEPTSQTQAVVIAGFMGSALTFVFGQEISTRTARQAAASTAAANGTIAANGLG